jgi:hypothetical protein
VTGLWPRTAPWLNSVALDNHVHYGKGPPNLSPSDGKPQDCDVKVRGSSPRRIAPTPPMTTETTRRARILRIFLGPTVGTMRDAGALAPLGLGRREYGHGGGSLRIPLLVATARTVQATRRGISGSPLNPEVEPAASAMPRAFRGSASGDRTRTPRWTFAALCRRVAASPPPECYLRKRYIAFQRSGGRGRPVPWSGGVMTPGASVPRLRPSAYSPLRSYSTLDRASWLLVKVGGPASRERNATRPRKRANRIEAAGPSLGGESR